MSKFKASKWRGEGCVRYAHMKLDGHWVYLTKNAAGLVIVETSTPVNITNALPTAMLSPFARNAPPNTCFWGELFVPGAPASQVKSAIKNDPASLELSIFAVEQLPAAEKLEVVSDVVRRCGLRFAPWITLGVAWDAASLLEACLSDGYEGAVLKYGNMLDWFKLKADHTIDLVVSGYEMGKGKYSGLIGSLICRTSEGDEVANVSGMTDAERREMSKAPHELVGKVVEVSYQYVGSQGRLRHPVFKRIRDDKGAHECPRSQMD